MEKKNSCTYVDKLGMSFKKSMINQILQSEEFKGVRPPICQQEHSDIKFVYSTYVHVMKLAHFWTGRYMIKKQSVKLILLQ